MSTIKKLKATTEPDDLLICRRLKDLSFTYTKYAVSQVLFRRDYMQAALLWRHVRNLIATYGEPAVLSNWRIIAK